MYMNQSVDSCISDLQLDQSIATIAPVPLNEQGLRVQAVELWFLSRWKRGASQG